MLCESGRVGRTLEGEKHNGAVNPTIPLNITWRVVNSIYRLTHFVFA